MRTNNKRGISLIVLVITIIVMIILAAAIILSISNSGIIDKANKAKQDSDVANLKEYVNVLQAEWELMDADERASTEVTSSIAYVNKKLKGNGYKRRLNEDGILLEENTVAALDAGIQIGDTVTGYTLDSSKSSTTTSGKENTAPSGGKNVTQVNTPQTVNQTAYSTWKYIGIGENGELLIAPEMPMTGTANTMKLSGKGGYLNGPAELNTVCNALYSTNKGTARSMNMEDINRILNYTGTKASYFDVNYRLVTTSEAKKISEIGTLTNDKTPDGRPIGDYYADYYTIEESSADISATVEIKGFVFTEDQYWLSTPSVSLDLGAAVASFCVFLCCDYYIGANYAFQSDGVSFYKAASVRPVVQINSNISVSYNSSTHTLTLN